MNNSTFAYGDDDPDEPIDEILDLAIQNDALEMPHAEAMEELACILGWHPNLSWNTEFEIRQIFEAMWQGHNEEGSTSSTS
jgi:hypothetical protein